MHVPFLTNSSMMDVDFVPEHLVIVGGSYIGLEFGQMFRRFGSDVTIVEMGDRLIGREDEDVSAAIRDILEAEGIDVRLERQVHQPVEAGRRMSRRASTARAASSGGRRHASAARRRAPAEHRRPWARPAGVEVDARGYIDVDDELRTNVPGIWALGDCNGRGAFTHTSFNDAEIVVANLLENDHAPRQRPHSRPTGCSSIRRSAAPA